MGGCRINLVQVTGPDPTRILGQLAADGVGSRRRHGNLRAHARVRQILLRVAFHGGLHQALGGFDGVESVDLDDLAGIRQLLVDLEE